MLELICWLLPRSRMKNRLLSWLGHSVAGTASIGPTIVWNVGNLTIGEYVHFGFFNVFRDLTNVRFSDHALVESWNWISAHPGYQAADANAGSLFLGYCAKIGSRNYLDCSGTIVLREYGEVGGNRCFLQTHEPDYEKSCQTVGRITIGHHSQVASGAVMLKGAFLPDQSMLAANSTMLRSSSAGDKRGLYAGSPAQWKRDTTGSYFERRSNEMTVYVVDEPMGPLAADANSGRYEIERPLNKKRYLK